MNGRGNIFLDALDISRIAYTNSQNTLTKGNKVYTDALESDLFMNHKENFEMNNTRINDLNDEVRELKNRLKIISEKDKEIYSLQCENKNLISELEELKKYEKETIAIRKENQSIRNKLDSIMIENVSLHSKLDAKDAKDANDTNDNLIAVDISKIKNILCSRLKSYHEKHIDDLILSYGLVNKKEIEKETMERLLVEAIHI